MVAMTKTAAGVRLGDVPQEKRFWCSDGTYLKNLRELAAALRRMSDETFHSHYNATKSDFGKWVREVVGDDKLARDLDRSSTKLQAARNVAERITWLESKI